MHFHDPRHDASIKRVTPLITETDQVFLEISKDDETEMMRLFTSDPGVYSITKGPSLMERLGPEAWAKLTDRLRSRGIPPFLAAKYQPWFLGINLMMPECVIEDLKAKRFGIDRRLNLLAVEMNRPTRSLDDPKALLAYFAKDPLDQQVAQMRWSLLLDLPEDPTTSGIVNFYFQEETQMAWVYTMYHAEQSTRGLPQADAKRLSDILHEIMDDLIIGRNEAWVQKLVPELENTPSFVAVGALHLPGEKGVLQLLHEQGFSIQRLPLEQR
jgi:uncharacterized protein YbaP (TraB family)